MGLEAVKEEIVRYAKEQETSLLAEARREASRMTKETEKKIEEMKEKSESEYKKMTDIIKRQALASAELENRKIILETKAVENLANNLIDQLFDYLRNSKYELGYFINFSGPKLYMKRVIYTNDKKKFRGI